jgi:hypothetical protein
LTHARAPCAWRCRHACARMAAAGMCSRVGRLPMAVGPWVDHGRCARPLAAMLRWVFRSHARLVLRQAEPFDGGRSLGLHGCVGRRVQGRVVGAACLTAGVGTSDSMPRLPGPRRLTGPPAWRLAAAICAPMIRMTSLIPAMLHQAECVEAAGSGSNAELWSGHRGRRGSQDNSV